MSKFKVMLVALAAGVFVAGQVGVAKAATLVCTSGGDDAGPTGQLNGTYNFSFLGSNIDSNSPLAGSGSVTLDGKGNVTGGVIRCNQAGAENVTPITGGCYTINSDGTGFMAIVTTTLVCGKDNGVDLQLAVGTAGKQFQFSSDGGIVNSKTGWSDELSGTANRWPQ